MLMLAKMMILMKMIMLVKMLMPIKMLKLMKMLLLLLLMILVDADSVMKGRMDISFSIPTAPLIRPQLSPDCYIFPIAYALRRDTLFVTA